jgi:hypothetical protein
MCVLPACQWIREKNNFFSLTFLVRFPCFIGLEKERHPVLPGWRHNIKTIRK